jgi:phosphoserine phosphatase
VYVVSGTPAVVFGDLAARLGIAGIVGLELEHDHEERATGRHAGTPTVGPGKVTRLRAAARERCLFAAGNSALDLALLEASEGLAWAVGPDATLAAAAARAGWLVTTDCRP